MKSYEMVETLSDKAKVTLAEAKEALEKSNWDMLDAAIYLEEHKGERAQKAQGGAGVPHLTSLQKEQNGEYVNPNFGNAPQGGQQGASFSEMFGRACGNAENAVNRGMKSNFIVSKDGRILFQLPLLVFLILTLAFFPTAVTFFIIGLFFDFKYSFGDNAAYNEQFNGFVDKAKSTTAKMKEDFIAGRESTKQ